MEDFHIQNAIQRATGSEELDALMQQELRAEQMAFYQRMNQQQIQQPGWDAPAGQGGPDFLDKCFGAAIIIFVVGFVIYAIVTG